MAVRGRYHLPMLIRLASPADAAAVRQIYTPAVERTPISFEVVAPAVAEMARRIVDHADEHPWLVAEDGGAVLGYAYAGQFRARAAYRWSVETSVYVAGGARRRGGGRTLYASLLSLLAAQGYHRAFAGITLPNPASVGLHEAMGFARLGVFREVGWKLGSWHDVGWWQRQLAAPSRGAAPEPPRRLRELDPAAVEAALGRPRGT